MTDLFTKYDAAQSAARKARARLIIEANRVAYIDKALNRYKLFQESETREEKWTIAICAVAILAAWGAYEYMTWVL